MAEVTVVETAQQVRELVSAWRSVQQTVALVPTMGNLHRGHMSLARLARDIADRVVMSIYVNPTQFGEGEDFGAYPRTPGEDLRRIEAAGTVDALFVPSHDEIYPFGLEQAVRIAMPAISRELCGAHRPGHFDGVVTVVARLLNIVQPDAIVLGEKDYQQLVIIERMVEDLHIPVRVVAGSIERDQDGLALSSRNRYLSSTERNLAPQLHEALENASQALLRGEDDYDRIARRAAAILEDVGFKVDYIEIRDAGDLSRPNGRHEPHDLVVLGAAWLGRARLIDNVRL